MAQCHWTFVQFSFFEKENIDIYEDSLIVISIFIEENTVVQF